VNEHEGYRTFGDRSVNELHAAYLKHSALSRESMRDEQADLAPGERVVHRGGIGSQAAFCLLALRRTHATRVVDPDVPAYVRNRVRLALGVPKVNRPSRTASCGRRPTRRRRSGATRRTRTPSRGREPEPEPDPPAAAARRAA